MKFFHFFNNHFLSEFNICDLGLMKMKNGTKFTEIFQNPPSYKLSCKPTNFEYDVKRYEELEEIVVASSKLL